MHLPDDVAARLDADQKTPVRVLVRIAAKTWPELAGRVLVYLLDGEDVRTAQIPVYLPDSDTWIHVSSATVGASNSMTKRADQAQTDTAKTAIEYELGVRTKIQQHYRR